MFVISFNFGSFARGAHSYFLVVFVFTIADRALLSLAFLITQNIYDVVTNCWKSAKGSET